VTIEEGQEEGLEELEVSEISEPLISTPDE
jgi:hypothetical protein